MGTLSLNVANAQTHSVALGWTQERIKIEGVVQQVAQPSLQGLHEFDLTPGTNLQVSWDMAPENPYVRKPEQLFSDLDINIVQVSFAGRHGAWSWTAGIQPAFLDDRTVQPASIYSADFATETVVSEQLLMGVGWEGESVQLTSAVFRRSPFDALHVQLGRHRPRLTWNTGLTDTKKFDSWLFAVEGKDRTQLHWDMELAHLATNRPGEHDAQQWMGSLSGQAPFDRRQRWNVELGHFQHFRGSSDHARSAMLNWSVPVGPGALQFAKARRWRLGHSNEPDIVKLALTELSYSMRLTENLNLLFGVSTTRDWHGKGSAVGLVASYTWSRH